MLPLYLVITKNRKSLLRLSIPENFGRCAQLKVIIDLYNGRDRRSRAWAGSWAHYPGYWWWSPHTIRTERHTSQPTGGPNSVEVRWDFEFIRESMKINKIGPKVLFFFFTKIEIKMTQHVKSRFSLFFFPLNHICSSLFRITDGSKSLKIAFNKICIFHQLVMPKWPE